MDPDDLAKLNQLLAGLNPNGGVQPNGPDSSAGPPQQGVYWPDTWLSAEPTPEDYANALIADRATNGGLSDPWAGLGMSKPTPEEYAAVMLAQRGAPIGPAHRSTGLGPDGGQPSVADMLQGQGPTSSGASVVPVSWHGPAASLSMMDSLRAPPAPTRSPPDPLAPSGLPGFPTFQNPPSPPSQQDRDAAAYELLKQGATPDADYYPSENDALANMARGRAAPSWDPVPNLTPVIGTHGYQPAKGDEDLLARLIHAESNSAPQDLPAIGWAVVNRIGAPTFGRTLGAVVAKDKAFASVPAKDDPYGGSAQWRLTADPSKLTGPDAAAWRRAHDTAKGILNGTIADPTSGAQYFFSSQNLSGDPAKAAPPGFFQEGLANGTLLPSQYQGHRGYKSPGHPTRNYFAKDAPRKQGSTR